MSKQKTTWIAALVFLLMGLVQAVWAEPALEEQAAERVNNANIQVNVPKTPEKLLQVFKDLLADPDVDGQEFCEKRLGIDRSSWVESNPRTIYKKHLEPSFGSPPLPSAPFHFQEATINHQDKLSVLVLTFYKNPSFRITPALTRQILGEPENISVSEPNVDYSPGQYRISYRYSAKNYKKLYFTFRNADEANTPEIKKAFRKHTPEQIQIEQAHRMLFETHKEYQAIVIEVGRHGND